VKRFLAKQKTILIEGLVFLFIFGFVWFLTDRIWTFSLGIARPFVQNSYLNMALNILLVSLSGYIFGLLLRIDKVRKWVNNFLKALPLVSKLIKAIEFWSRIIKLGKCEVEYEEIPGQYTLGLVTKEWPEKEKTFCSVYNPIQMPPGGKTIKRLKADLHFTGRSPLDCVLTHYLGGLYASYPGYKKNKKCLCQHCRK
jgi:hypothetical protein